MYYYYILIKFKLTKLEWTVRSWGGGAMMSKIEKTGDDERCLHEREGDVG